jgi:hypothetical protein
MNRLKRYVIERHVPGIGKADLAAAAIQSNNALDKLAPDIQWVHSYVADDKTFCIYLAANEDAIMQHANLSGFPANKITRIVDLFDPTTHGPDGRAA